MDLLRKILLIWSIPIFAKLYQIETRKIGANYGYCLCLKEIWIDWWWEE